MSIREWLRPVSLPVVALVGWARWWVGAHTGALAVVATVPAVGITDTVGTFWVMGVPLVVPL